VLGSQWNKEMGIIRFPDVFWWMKGING